MAGGHQGKRAKRRLRGKAQGDERLRAQWLACKAPPRPSNSERTARGPLRPALVLPPQLPGTRLPVSERVRLVLDTRRGGAPRPPLPRVRFDLPQLARTPVPWRTPAARPASAWRQRAAVVLLVPMAVLAALTLAKTGLGPSAPRETIAERAPELPAKAELAHTVPPPRPSLAAGTDAHIRLALPPDQHWLPGSAREGRLDVVAALPPALVVMPPDSYWLPAPALTATLPRLQLPRPEPGYETAARLVAAALAQTLHEVRYDPRYVRIAYPMGDVPDSIGVCTDVVVRAYRGLGIDLQELVHVARVGRGDKSMDHRRVQVLRRFFDRNALSLPVSPYPEAYKPGDLVTYDVPWGRTSKWHIAIVSDQLSPSLRPMVVHNRGYGPKLEDALFHKRITGHYRYYGPAQPTVQPPEQLVTSAIKKSPRAAALQAKGRS